jgi:signal transduction histidine kinase
MGSLNPAPPSPVNRPSAERRVRWIVPVFFVIWTAVVMLSVWWIRSGDAAHQDLLIALDRPENGSLNEKARRWVSRHMEVYWAYAWVLMAPYVIGLSLRFALEKAGLAWRIALHVVMGVGFILVSQTLTGRLASLRPKAVFVEKVEIVREEGPPRATNDLTAAFTRRIEWRVDPEAKSDHKPNLTPALTNGTPRDLARGLAPLIERQLRDTPDPKDLLAPRKLIALDGVAYLALIGVAQAIHLRRRFGEREALAEALEARLAQSRLHALRGQLQPHFLFNALNGIAALVRRDPGNAEEMLTSLSDLLRASLAQSGRQEIPLREELEFVTRYLDLQQMRLGDRLRVEREIDADAAECLVPSLVLQPLVENALRHGIEPSPNPGVLRIIARLAREEVHLCVEDNGVGLGELPDALASSGSGVGLRSIRERLRGLYAEHHEFALRQKPGGGVVAEIRVPRRLPLQMGSAPPDNRA